MVQHASFLILSRDCPSNSNKEGKAEQFKTTCVCTSSPVTMLPTALRAALVTLC